MCLFCNKTDFSVLLFDFRVNCKKILNLLDKLYTYIYIYANFPAPVKRLYYCFCTYIYNVCNHQVLPAQDKHIMNMS